PGARRGARRSHPRHAFRRLPDVSVKAVLIANRGEIAVSIARACREHGLAAVAVYSEADRGAPHTFAADRAVPIGPPPAVHSYLNIEALLAAARQSGADGGVYLEKLLVRPRHVEVQVLGDRHGTLVHLGERECSIQRRHQKIVEETPCPVLTPRLRTEMTAAALAAARAVGYTSAGTVEFLLDVEGRFYFLEMNTRVQVEHPITEWVTGIDIVAAQLRIAAGAPLGFGQADVRARGHAIQARPSADDP